MPRHHYLPASYLGLFSSDKVTIPRRKRLLGVGDKQEQRCFTAPASKVGCKKNLYASSDRSRDPNLFDQAWREYERHLPSAVHQLINNKVDVDTWTRVLVPFVACMLVRGPDFNTRFDLRLRALGIDQSFPISDDNTNGARFFELQRLLGPVMVAKWIVLTVHGEGMLITNDLGYAPFINPGTDDYGMAIPLGHRNILVISPMIERDLARAKGNKWVPIIEYIHSPPNDHIGLNKAVSGMANRFIFGPDEDIVNRYLCDTSPVKSPDPVELGFITAPLARAHEFTWHRFVSSIKKPPKDVDGWDFHLDVDEITNGWNPWVFLPGNLVEFPPALERKGNIIRAKFYDPEFYYSLSCVMEFERMGDLNKVVDECTKNLDLVDTADYKVWLLIARGGALSDLEKNDDALEDYDRAIKINPSSAHAYTDKGHCLLKIGRTLEAIEALNRAIEIKHDIGPAYLNRGVAYASIDENDNALKDLNMAQSLLLDGPAKAAAFLSRGNVYISKKYFKEAIDDFTVAIEMYPDPPEKSICHFRRAAANYCLRFYPEALRDVNEAIELSPRSSEALSLRSAIHMDQDDFQLAIHDLDSIIDMENKSEQRADALRRKAIALSELRRFREAMSCFSKSLQLTKNRAFVLYDKGLSLLVQAKFSQAINTFKRVLKDDPINAKALNNLGISLAHKGRHVEAIEYFSKGLSAEPEGHDKVSAIRNKAISLALLERLDEAERCICEAESIKPNTINTLIARGRYEWFCENYQTAMEIHRKAEETEGEEKFKNPFIVMPLLSLGEVDKAFEIINDWLKKSPPPIVITTVLMDLKYLKSHTPYNEGIDDIITLLKRNIRSGSIVSKLIEAIGKLAVHL